LLRIDALLREGPDSDLRAFLQGAHVIIGRTVSGCDDTIADLDREREVRRPAGEFSPGGPRDDSRSLNPSGSTLGDRPGRASGGPARSPG
jgi:hypothetical protein